MTKELHTPPLTGPSTPDRLDSPYLQGRFPSPSHSSTSLLSTPPPLSSPRRSNQATTSVNIFENDKGETESSSSSKSQNNSLLSSRHTTGKSTSSQIEADKMMAMPMLSLRKKRGMSLSNPVTQSSRPTASLRKSIKTPSTEQRNLGLLIILIVCLIVYLIPTQRESLEAEGAPPTPYTVRKSYLRKGSGWVVDHARVMTDVIPRPALFKDGKPKSISNSKPHPVQNYPEFQDKMYKLTAKTWPEYEAKLVAFSKQAFPKQLASWAVESVRARSPRRRHDKSLANHGIPAQIWQTGKDIPTIRNSFQDQNPRASYNFFDDSLLESWSKQHFGGSLVKKVWDGMERVVLKADFWRYLVIFLEGGYYSDTDTDCLKPVDVWGSADAVTWDMGDEVTKELAYAPPQVVVGIEVDVPDVTGWETFWPRPVQIVQWTMSGSPGHPIYLDSIRRVVESMNVVKDWDSERKAKAADLLGKLTNSDSTLKERIKHLEDQELWDQLRKLLTVDPFDKERGGKMSLIEATGPGAFSDAVFSYLQARYGIHWSQLHNIQTATRIGEIAILPITGFAPFWKPDWQRWKGLDRGAMAVVGDITHPQAMVNHHFSGSWRQDSDNAA